MRSLITTSGRPSGNKFDLMANGEYTSGDPGFVNAAKGDFRLKSDAEVFCRIGFRQFPWRRSDSTRMNIALPGYRGTAGWRDGSERMK